MLTAVDFEDLYNKNKGRMFKDALAYVKHSDCEDVVQDALLGAWIKRGDFQGPKGKLIWWVLGFVRYVGLSEVRRRRRYITGAFEVLEEAVLMDVELVLEVGEAIDMLPPKQRRAMQLRMSGFSTRDIAGEMCISESSATSNVALARRKLRQYLAME